MRKLVFGVVWCLVIYIAASMVIGGIAGGIAGSHAADAQSASQAGYRAGAKAVQENRGYMIAGAILLSAIGSGFGVLPGTRAS